MPASVRRYACCCDDVGPLWFDTWSACALKQDFNERERVFEINETPYESLAAMKVRLLYALRIV